MRRPVVVVLVLVLVAMVMPGRRAHAQSTSTSTSADELLAIPRGPIACKEKVVTPADSAASVFQVLDLASTERSRRFMFAFDSAGNPRYGSILREDVSDSTHQTEELLVARLAGQVGGMRARAVNGEVDAAPVTRDSVPGFPRGALALTADDLARATSLARWVWERRCSASRTRPVAPPAAAPKPQGP